MRISKLARSLAVAILTAGTSSSSVIGSALLVGAFAGGCGGASVSMGDTHVGKEELYKTGNFDYDEFFEDVHGLQGSAKAIVNDEKAARAPLGQMLGVGETSIDRMLEVLRDKTDELAQSKNRVHFAIDGVDADGKPLAGKQITVTTTSAKGRPVPKEATELASAIEQMAQKEGDVWERYAPLPERSKHLVERADALNGSLAKEFATVQRDKRDEIERELKAAKSVSEQIGELSEKVVANSVKFIKQSGELMTAAANAEIKPQDKGAKGPKGKPPAPPTAKPKDAPTKPKEAAPKPASSEKPAEKPAAAPAPKPTPAAEGSGDFNP